MQSGPERSLDHDLPPGPIEQSLGGETSFPSQISDCCDFAVRLCSSRLKDVS